MEEAKIRKEIIKSCDIIPIEKTILVRPEKVDTGSLIQIPDKVPDGGVSAGQAVLVAEKVGDDCMSVMVGDFVISKANAKSLAKFEIVDDEYLMIDESEVAVVLRPK